MPSDACAAQTAGIIERARRIRLVVSDCDGVLTDGGVYYAAAGEVSKRFHIRDGMGVERLRKLAGIETILISGEGSPAIRKRAEKLSITECHLGIEDKAAVLQAIAARRGFPLTALAYIGDDVNDLAAMALAGLSACPGDAFADVREKAHIVCAANGGQGAFREFAEILIAAGARRRG
jgi:3-deoxy-D-manno-octulosonate 8-phosphate phosphatase (KDO 8-P phosphatase)